MTVGVWAIILCSFVCLVLSVYIVYKRCDDKGFWAGAMFSVFGFLGNPFVTFFKEFIKAVVGESVK